MQIHQLSAADAIASLNSSPQGLASDEALQARRIRPQSGGEVARESILLRFLKEFTHFFALILWLAAAGLAFLAEWSDPGHGMAKVGYAILAVILVSGMFSFWQEFRVERTLAAWRGLLPQHVDVLRDGKAVRLLADQLVPGDITSWSKGTTSGGLSIGRGLRSSGQRCDDYGGIGFQTSHCRTLRR
jgi:sodium/potassium-transporting ATPase subunit alpha